MAAPWVRQVAAGTTPTQVRAQVLENANGSFAAVRTHIPTFTAPLPLPQTGRLFSLWTRSTFDEPIDRIRQEVPQTRPSPLL
ncbi:MAG: hypothetical protein EOP64_08915 [Sphingomonas sp.]|nr:MAG: hypothetical protein EOP64_08915 [Sphingomonas sp.]